MTEIDLLAQRWDAEAEILAFHGDERGAGILRTCATQLRAAAASQEASVIGLEEASRESGYSKDHIRYMLREGRITNAGEKGRPRMRRGDLPMKPGRPKADTFSAEDEAKRIVGRIRGHG